MAVLVPDEARAGALRHLQHVQRKGILPRGEVGDVDDGGGVLLEEPHGGELVGLEPPRGGDDEGGGWVDVGDEERRGKGDGSEDGDDGFEQPTGRRDRR